MNYKDITLEQYYKIIEIKASDDLDNTIQLAQVIFGEDVINLTPREFASKVKELDFLKEAIPDKVPDSSVFNLNGTEYTADFDMTTMTTGQYIDFVNLSKSGKLNEVLAVFFRPVGCSIYNEGYDMAKVIEDLKQLDVESANGAAFFFKSQLEILMNLFLHYSIQKVRKLKIDKKTKKMIVNRMKEVSSLMDLVSLVQFRS